MPCYVLIVKGLVWGFFCFFVFWEAARRWWPNRIWVVSGLYADMVSEREEKAVLYFFCLENPNMSCCLSLNVCWTTQAWGKMDAALVNQPEHTESCHASLAFSCPVPTHMLSSVLAEPHLPLFAHKIVGYNCIQCQVSKLSSNKICISKYDFFASCYNIFAEVKDLLSGW